MTSSLCLPDPEKSQPESQPKTTLQIFALSLRSLEDQESSEPEKTLSVEGHLVDNITSEGGIRAVPSKEALNQFTKR